MTVTQSQCLVVRNASVRTVCETNTDFVHQHQDGTGTAWFKRGEESKIDQAIIDTVKTAIKLGYTHLDGAEGSSQFHTPLNPDGMHR